MEHDSRLQHDQHPKPSGSPVASAPYQRLTAEQMLVLYLPALLRYAAKLTGNWEEAQDLSMETLYRAWRDLASRGILPTDIVTTEIHNPPGWLYRILSNLFINSLRRPSAQSRQIDRLPSNEDGSHMSIQNVLVDPAAEQAIFSVANRIVLQDYLMKLQPHQRMVLILRDEEGLTYEEISEHLNIPMTTVKSRLYDARQNLKSFYAQDNAEAATL